MLQAQNYVRLSNMIQNSNILCENCHNKKIKEKPNIQLGSVIYESGNRKKARRSRAA